MSNTKYGGYRCGSLVSSIETHFQRHYYFFDCARHAINALSERMAVTEIIIPNYYCKPIEKYLSDCGFKITKYSINGFSDFQTPSFRPHALLILPNYFGLSDLKHIINVAKFDALWPSENILVDSSLAVFDHFTIDKSVAHVFSPRKFLPITEGGLIYSPYFKLQKGAMLESPDRILRSQLADPDNLQSAIGSKVYGEIEASFSRSDQILGLDEVQVDVLKSVDWAFYQSLFRRAHKAFSDFDGVVYSAGSSVGNCVLIERSAITNVALAQSGKGVYRLENGYEIFIPKLWDGINPTTDFEFLLNDRVIFVPVFWDISSADIEIIHRFIYGNYS